MSLEDQLWVILNIALAMVLGGFIGYEREKAHKPAGFRTHMLVAGTTALLVHLGSPLIEYFASHTSGVDLRPDPLRLFEAVVTGIAFLGAGTIIRRTENGGVEGLTTAGSLLMSGVIGICVALQQFLLAVGVTFLTFLLLRSMMFIELRFSQKKKRFPVLSWDFPCNSIAPSCVCL